MATLRLRGRRISLMIGFAAGLLLLLWVSVGLTKAYSPASEQQTDSIAAPLTPSGLITVAGRHLQRNGVNFRVRGMNYYPKDFAWERFWLSYTTALPQIATELAQAQALGVNTVRIFLPYALFQATHPQYFDHLADFLTRLQAHNMVAIVTLFDFYPSAAPTPYAPADYANSFQHIATVINRIGITNPTVLAWDLKNELDRDYSAFGVAPVNAWATAMLQHIRQLDPYHLVTLGFYGVSPGPQCDAPTVTSAAVYSPAIASAFAAAVDFVSLHYFLPERCFAHDLRTLQNLLGEQPIVLEEFGLHSLAAPAQPCVIQPTTPLCDDGHSEREQAAYFNTLLALAEAYDLAGTLFWTLNDFSYLAAGLQESSHCQGILRNPLVTRCQQTTTLAYSRKPAAEQIQRHYAPGLRYLDLFDGWVDLGTDAPPPGWTDNWQSGGALLRGYNPAQPLWSHTPGTVAFAKFVADGVSRAGTALSPWLAQVNIDEFPILSGQIHSYQVRDLQHGSHARLHISVQQGEQITRLLTFTPATALPYTFSVDLRQAPTHWQGTQDFQVRFELEPIAPGNGYAATYEFDWLALRAAPQSCAKLYDPGNGWAVEMCPTDPQITAPMTVVVDGQVQGQAALVRIYHQAEQTAGAPQVAVIYASGYLRLKPNADPQPPIPFGASFVLGPAYWPTQNTYYHNPQLTRLEINTQWLPHGPLRLRATGHNQAFAVAYELTLPPPRDAQTRLHVLQFYTATTAVTIDPTRWGEAQGLKLVQASSIFINQTGECAGGHQACHDSNAVRFINQDLTRRQVQLADLTPSTFLFNPPQPLGNTWLDLLHTDQQGWQGATPSLRIVLDDLPPDHTVTPQGWLQATTNPNDDNLGLWLHADDPSAQSWPAGQSRQIGYWLLATVDPPEPWRALGQRDGRTLLDFEQKAPCHFVHDRQQATSGALQTVAGYQDNALQLTYALGNRVGNWVQMRCDFDPPLDLTAYDHLRLDWRGDPQSANSLQIALVNPGPPQETIFARGYPHVTQRAWWGQLVIPFRFLAPWTPNTRFDPQRVSAFFVSVVQDPQADTGGAGRLALDQINAYAVLTRTIPLTFEKVAASEVAARAALRWLVNQQQPSGLLPSWAEETLCTAHIYDQALALLVFVRAQSWRNADLLANRLGVLQNADGSWSKSYACHTGQPVHPQRWEGDIAWATYALSVYVRQRPTTGGREIAQMLAVRDRAATWLQNRVNPADGCLVIDHTEATLDVWWALQSAGAAYQPAARQLQACLLTFYWDETLGRFKGGRYDWWQPYLDNQTWGSAFLRATGHADKARRALSYAYATLLLPAQGSQLWGLDGQGGPWALWNEGVGQYVAMGGAGANQLVQELRAQQRRDGALPGAPDAFTGGGVWTTRWHGVAPTAWLYFAETGSPLQPQPATPAQPNPTLYLPLLRR